MSTSETRSTRSTPATPTAAPLSRRVPPAVLVTLLLAVSIVSAWSALGPAGDPEAGEPRASISAPSLADLDSSKPPVLPASRRVGVVEDLTPDRLGVIVNSDGETLLLTVAKPAGPELGKGAIIELEGREVARTRFGQATLRGSYAILKAAPRAPASPEPRSGPTPASATPAPETKAPSTPSSTAPRLDQLFGK